MMRFLIIVTLLLCSSCIQLGGETPVRQYYVLRAMTETSQINSSKAIAIDLKLTNFPEYLSRTEIVTYIQTNRVKIAYDASWAEPLADNLLRILRRNLGTLLPLSQISLSPWESNNPEALRVELLVNNFSGQLGGETDVDVNWLIKKDNQIID
ncbi:MAG: PqiC family protein, partial [Deltaproteobacteria bacterium]|nr:PqiC family protein [Deltaproteobacteria bacterium]